MNYRITRLRPFGTLIEAINENSNIQELEIEKLRQLFQESQLIVIRGFDTFEDSNHFSDYCDKWGKVSVWPFGKVLELKQHQSPQDHIFDNSYVPLHWDGMYRPQVPEYQIFHCVKAPLIEHGGRTIFSNTILALEHVSDELKELWSKVIGIYQREMEFYKSKVISPVITKHPLRDFSVIRYNEPHSNDKGNLINIPNLMFTGVENEELALFHKTLKQKLYHSQNLYAHQWQDGDVVIADNFSLLHGREKFTSGSPRYIRRVQVLSDPPYANPNLESYK
ncbi:MAG: TauD/TfdA family dioxygenase [Bacteriovoracaceae bacterium]|jgi:alpha-ketoglutarate-dependent taurine dioxygenase|nr:TauD/TfdA family dioxygenase [Bacteriovoracaceae bacterium]